jgi:hypothetical protein
MADAATTRGRPGRPAQISRDLAEQGWYIFITSVVSWLATREEPLNLGRAAPRFELFLGALLRGLPAREPGATRT